MTVLFYGVFGPVGFGVRYVHDSLDRSWRYGHPSNFRDDVDWRSLYQLD